MSLLPVLQGFGLGLSMIIPIGAQNAFVLTHGIRKHYHLMVAGICIFCDVLLICAGVYGGAELIQSGGMLGSLLTWGGVAFLTVYGLLSLRAALFSKPAAIDDQQFIRSRKKTLLITLGVTLLNPHVYLDTVMVLGSFGGQFEASAQHLFVLGCALASLVWFLALSCVAARLSPWLKQAKVQACIDGFVGVFMLGFAVALAQVF